MITIEHEQPRDGSGEGFRDCVSVDFCDGENGLFGLVRVTRAPGAPRARGSAIILSGEKVVEQLELESEQPLDDGRLADAGAIEIATVVPLERWSLEVSGGAASLKLDATAVSPPLELAGGVAEPAGIARYEQLCEMTGVITVDGRSRDARCIGRRAHSWGEFAWDRIDRWRTLYAASGTGRAISVTTARPAGSHGHGEELRAASLVDASRTEQFESVRISTVWDRHGAPAKAGLELDLPGDEIPTRMGGEIVGGTRSERGDHSVSLSFFRWSLEGVPALGAYEVLERR